MIDKNKITQEAQQAIKLLIMKHNITDSKVIKALIDAYILGATNTIEYLKHTN